MDVRPAEENEVDFLAQLWLDGWRAAWQRGRSLRDQRCEIF